MIAWASSCSEEPELQREMRHTSSSTTKMKHLLYAVTVEGPQLLRSVQLFSIRGEALSACL